MRYLFILIVGLLIGHSAFAKNVVGNCDQAKVLKFVDAGYNKTEIARLCGKKTKATRSTTSKSDKTKAVRRKAIGQFHWFLEEGNKWRRAHSKHVPMGMATSDGLTRVWSHFKSGNFKTSGRLLQLSRTATPQEKIFNEEMRDNPGVYVAIAAYRSWSPHEPKKKALDAKYGNLPPRDPMVDFAEGIGGFVNHYINDDSKADLKFTVDPIKSIEIPFLKAIFKTADINTWERRLDNYLGASNDDKVALIKQVLKNLEGQNFRNQLISSWASMWLANHYWMMNNENQEKNEPLLQNINKNLEVPLRKYTGRLRATKGGKKYFNSYM